MTKFFFRNAEWPNGMQQAASELLAGRHRHDVLEDAVRLTELDPSIATVGYGGAPNLLGEMELDGAFMNGDTRGMGAVSSVKSFLPVRIARKLMEADLHTLLTGEGAALFARQHGLTPEPTLSPEAEKEWREEVLPLLEKRGDKPLMEIARQIMLSCSKSYGTTVMAASDGNGLSVATSTSGLGFKHPGRVGDTPVSGAGFYVDSRFGACACTGTGEMSMRAGTSRYVVAQMEAGKSVHEAIDMAVKDMAALKGGLLGSITLHAADREGDMRVVSLNPKRPVRYWCWREGMPQAECREAETVRL